MSDLHHKQQFETSSQKVLNPNNETCTRCDQAATGSAFIEGERYCHGSIKPSCYELTLWKDLHKGSADE